MDTNIVSAYLKGNINVRNKLSQASISGEGVFINGIVYYEIKRGFLDINATTKLANFEQFRKGIKTIWLDNQDIFDEAATIWTDLKKKGQPHDDKDILIAATAKVRNLVIVTNNIKHFQIISGIQAVDWL